MSSHAGAIYHVHTCPTCFANSNDHVVLLLEGCEGIACATDANVNAKASAINLVMLLSLLPLAKSKAECGSVGLMQIKRGLR